MYSPQEAKGFWVYLEQESWKFLDVSLELLAKARELADRKKTGLTGIILGNNIKELAKEAIAFGCDSVIVAEHPLLETYLTESYTKVINDLVLKEKPDTFLIGATRDGTDLAGRLAVRLRTGLNAHCTELEIDDNGLLVGWVPGFGGGIAAGIKCEKRRPQISTVKAGVFPKAVYNSVRQGKIETAQVNISQNDITSRVLERIPISKIDISKSELIIAVGRGTEGKLELIKKLSGLLNSRTGLPVEIGGTRVATDFGWIEKDRMIGQTGTMTKPKLAICFGISGATQFTIGVDKAGVIVSLNSDESAPIFESSDYYIHDDLFKVLPLLVEELNK